MNYAYRINPRMSGGNGEQFVVIADSGHIGEVMRRASDEIQDVYPGLHLLDLEVTNVGRVAVWPKEGS